MSNNTLIPVPFRGVTLYVTEHQGQPFTPMKPIAEGMGLAWQPQHAKLKSHKQRWGITEMVIPSEGGEQTMTCLPLRKLPGWLMTIYPNKVKPEIRETIIAYQNECDDVLWQYWNQGQATNPRFRPEKTRKALPGGLTIEQQETKLKLPKALCSPRPAWRFLFLRLPQWEGVGQPQGPGGTQCRRSALPPACVGMS